MALRKARGSSTRKAMKFRRGNGRLNSRGGGSSCGIQVSLRKEIGVSTNVRGKAG